MTDLKEPTTTTILDQLMKESNQWNASNFELPVNKGLEGYAYDAETERVYVAGDKLFEIELMKDSSSSSWCPRIVRTFYLPHGTGHGGFVCVKLHNKLYVIGGYDNNYKRLNDVYSLDTTIGTWEKEASMKTKRYLPSVVLTKRGTIMVCGGNGDSGELLDTCEEYSDNTKQWTTLPYRLKEARYGHVSICHESRVVVIGGHNHSSKNLATTEGMDLDSPNPQWNSGPRLVEKRQGAAFSILGDYVVIAGGNNGNKKLESLEAIATTDLANGIGEWRLLSGCEMNNPRQFFGMELVDGCLLALGGSGCRETCEMLDASLLLPPTPFYRRLLQQDEQYTMEHRLEALAKVVGNVHESKILYTYVRQCIRQGLVGSSEGSDILESGLQASLESCVCEDAFDMFMLILDKAEADVLVTREDILRLAFARFSRGAGTKQQVKCHPTFVKSMKKALEMNMEHTGGVGHGVETLGLQVLMLGDKMKQVSESMMKIQDSFVVGQSGRQSQQNVDKLNESMCEARGRRSEAVAVFIASVLNAIAMGVDGTLSEGFEKFLAGVVDFGDTTHLLQVINRCLDDRESQEMNDAYATIKKQFEHGVELATKESKDELADAIQEGNAVVALGAVARLADVQEDRPVDADCSAIESSPTAAEEGVNVLPFIGKREVALVLISILAWSYLAACNLWESYHGTGMARTLS